MEDSTRAETQAPNLLEAALSYAERGWHVFPVRVAIVDGKKVVQPVATWREASTIVPAMIAAWFGEHGLYRDASVAIDCGKSGLVVVDTDGVTGRENWSRLEAPATWRARTPGGGEHHFYRAGEQVIGNDSTGKVAPKVDVRGLGGFVIAPPSADARGRYAWVEGAPASTAELPGTPAVVRDRMLSRRMEVPVASGAPGRALDPFGDPAREFTREEAVRYMAPILAAFRALRTPEDHGFNDHLNRVALEYAHFVPAFVSQEQAVGMLLAAAEHNGMVSWPGGGGERAVLATIHSGLSAETWKAQVRPDPAQAGSSLAPDENGLTAVDVLLSRMLDRDALDDVPLPTPLIRDVLDMDSESWIIGAPGGFKSFVALDWACHVALGLEWRGKPVTRGPVVYVAAEGSKGIPLRVKAWEATYDKRAEGVLFLPEPVQVGDALAWAVLVEACRRVGPALIVLDTQARITAGLEENSATTMGVMVEAVRKLKAATGACVLVIHHTGRDGMDARGSSAIDGAQDTELRVDRPKGKAGRKALTATISTDKQKDGEEAVSFEVQLAVVRLGYDPRDGRPLTSLALLPVDPFGVPARRPEPDWSANLTDNMADVMQAMRDHSDRYGATRAQALRWVNDRRKERELPPMAPSSFDSAVRDLVKPERDLLKRVKGPRLVLTELYESDDHGG